ncbi:MAG: AI-2E family transporter [Xanthobacteraceae bacterium]
MRLEWHIAFWIVALIVFVGLLWLLSPVLLPFVVGMATAYLLDPLTTRLSKRGLSRLVAALVILAGFVLAVAGLSLVALPVLVRQLTGFISGFIGALPNYVQHIQSWVTDPSHPWIRRIVGDNFAWNSQSVSNLMLPAIQDLNGLVSSLLSRGSALIELFSVMIVAPVVALYLICDWHRMLSSLDQLIPLPQRDTVRRLAREINASISAYVHGQSIVCVGLGCYYAAVLTAAGLQFGLLIGVVSGVISFIPYAGSFTALIVSVTVAIEQFYPHWGRVLIVAGVVVIGQFVEGNIVTPRILGKSIGLHPVWLIFALVAFSYLFGFVGLLLAVPLAAATGVLTRFALQRYHASSLYIGDGSV